MLDSKNNSAPKTMQIRFGGVGGQGIVLAGQLLGKAAALFDGKEAVCTQAYGPEARGGASRSDVVISDAPVNYPYVTKADVLAVLFQEAYTRFRLAVRPGGMVIVDTALVKLAEDDQNTYGIPATSIAEGLGTKMAANVVMLGYLVEKSGAVSRESVEQAIRTTLKQKIIDLNLKALEAGINLARSDAAS